MKKMEKRFRVENDISALWEKFRNDVVFDFDGISGINRVNRDTTEFSFNCRKNKFSFLPFPEFKGIVQSSEDAVSYISISPIYKSSKMAILLTLLVMNILNLMRVKVLYALIFTALFICAVFIDRYFYNIVLQKDLGDLEDRYELKMNESDV